MEQHQIMEKPFALSPVVSMGMLRLVIQLGGFPFRHIGCIGALSGLAQRNRLINYNT
jgi:hypothetical protein